MEKAVLLADGRSFGFYYPEKRSPAIIIWRAGAWYCMLLNSVSPCLSSLARLQTSLTNSVLTRHSEFSAWTISFYISCSGHFAQCSCKEQYIGVFLIGTAHASVKGDICSVKALAENGTAIVDSARREPWKKCTTGTTRHRDWVP